MPLQPPLHRYSYMLHNHLQTLRHIWLHFAQSHKEKETAAAIFPTRHFPRSPCAAYELHAAQPQPQPSAAFTSIEPLFSPCLEKVKNHVYTNNELLLDH